jgi:hypothetical protein
MDWKERDDGWFTWFECPNCGAREFSRRAECACCHIRLGKDEPKSDERDAEKNLTAKDIVEDIVKDTKAVMKTKRGTNGMKQENIYMLQYVAGALHGICTMMDEADKELKNVLFSLSEEVSNVVISETIDKEEEAKSKVSIYMDDGGDDGK